AAFRNVRRSMIFPTTALNQIFRDVSPPPQCLPAVGTPPPAKLAGFRHIPLAAHHINRHSPDDSETSVESSDFAASLEARREIWLATSSSRSPNDGRGVDLAIFTGIWTHSSCRLRLNA